MPRVPLSVVAVSTVLLMLPGSSEARSLRYSLHSAIFAPFGAVAGVMGLRYRSASHRRYGRHARHMAVPQRTAVQSPPTEPARPAQDASPRGAALSSPNETPAA